MKHTRAAIAGGLMLVCVGTLGGTAGYAWYLRSGLYRNYCAARLEATLGLPADVGGVVPRSRLAREFRDVVVWLPQRRDRALHCLAALVRYTPTREDPDEYEIELHGGETEISTRTWLRSDYRGVLESGLKPGFSPDGPRRVLFTGMKLAIERPPLRLEFHDASGDVFFRDAQFGRATLLCEEINGFAVPAPAQVVAEFVPQEESLRIAQLELRLPVLPLSAARLDQLAGISACSGELSDARLFYAEEADGSTLLTLQGQCGGLDLSELTAPFLPAPVRGACPLVELSELRLENQAPTRLAFRGRLKDVNLGDLLAAVGLPGGAGTASLDVGRAVLTPNGIEQFVASGRCDDVSLLDVTESLGQGRASGTLRMHIEDLTIVDNRLKSLAAVLTVEGAEDQPNWVESKLLGAIAKQALNITLPPFLPERIEYTHFGLRLDVQDEVLTVFGTHGEDEKTILTVRVLGSDLPIVTEPRRSFDLEPLLDEARARAAAEVRARVERTVTAP